MQGCQKNKICGGGRRKIKICGGGSEIFFPFRPSGYQKAPWNISNLFSTFSGAYTGTALWDIMIAVPGQNANTITLTVHTNITIPELKVKTSHMSTHDEPQFNGGFRFCDVTGKGSDVISYVCRCKQPQMCQWVYLEVNQLQPNSIYALCEATVS